MVDQAVELAIIKEYLGRAAPVKGFVVDIAQGTDGVWNLLTYSGDVAALSVDDAKSIFLWLNNIVTQLHEIYNIPARVVRMVGSSA